MQIKIDISGNWIWQDAPIRGLIVSQPEPPKEGNRFTQMLQIPAGICSLSLLYKSDCDHAPGKAVFYNFMRFSVFINDSMQDVTFSRIGDSRDYLGKIRFYHEGGILKLETLVQDTHCFNQTILEIESEEAKLPASSFYALPIAEEGQLTIVRGIPFWSAHHSEKIQMWNSRRWLSCPPPRWQMADWSKGEVFCGDVSVGTIYCLGMTHCYDVANGSWYSKTGDYGFHHFIGDQVGMMRLAYTEGDYEDIPLIYGWNVWYGMPWDLNWDQQNNQWAGSFDDMRSYDNTFFYGDEQARRTVQQCVGLDDGIRRMGEEGNERYVFTLRLEGRKLHSICILPQEDKCGLVTLSAVTLQASANAPLRVLPCISSSEGRLTIHTIKEVRDQSYLPSLKRLQRIFYTFTDELPVLSEPVIPEGYIGPAYDFKGTQDALLAATYLYRNGPECASFISDDGMGCSSNTAHWRTTVYMTGTGLIFGTKPPYNGIEDFLRKYAEREAGEFPGSRDAWSRGIGELLREAMALGYDKCISNYVNWLDDCMFRYANPPHWNRVMAPDAEGYTTRMVGEIEERGNRENDGHGICMWGRYMIWLWNNRDTAWNLAHWEATKAACEWLKWQLDTDTTFPGVRKDVLYTESECAHGDYDTYSTGNCLHGLELSIRMAKQLGKEEDVQRWQILYHRLAQGMLDHLQEESDYGPIWHTEKECDWQDHVHKLVHLQLATEGNTYTPLEDYTEGIHAMMLENDKNSYRYLMRNRNYDYLRMYGYGQGIMTQAALLLDEMYDAEQLLHMMVTHNYLPRMEGFLAPEGIIVHPSGKFYVPVNGYMGLDSHLADSVKAIRLLLGVDDNREGKLRLVPRFPETWTHCGIKEYPVLTDVGRGKLSYMLERKEGHFKMEICLSAPISMDLRVGPFSKQPADVVKVNGHIRSFETFKSGDAWWGWVRGLSGIYCHIEV